LTPDGDRRIDEVRPDDWVLARPEDDPEAVPAPRRVDAVFRGYAPLLHLRVGGRVIRTTAEQPFWVPGKGWTAAHRLTAGDPLLGHDGMWRELQGVDRDQGAAPVYNLRVAEYHTYFVGARSWTFSAWSHNAFTVDRNQLQAVKARALADATDAGLGILHLPSGTIHIASASQLPAHSHIDFVQQMQLKTVECRGFTIVQDRAGRVIAQNFSGLNVGMPGSVRFGMEQSLFDDVVKALRSAGL
jgi:hypothetical protein